MSDARRSVLITGASSGIGQATAKLLAERGYRVYAGVRCDVKGRELATGGHDRITPLRLEITCPDQVESAVLQIRESCPGGLFALINNAGVGATGAVELSDLDEVRHLLEVNTVGPLRMIQAFLPLLREARGRVINISSLNGAVSLPMVGAYSASKFALEALSDALRIELRPWGIPVSVIRPGQVRTPIFDKARHMLAQRTAQIPPNLRGGYHKLYRRAGDFNERGAKSPTRPEAVARVIARVLEARRPRPRYSVGLDAHGMGMLQRMIPQWLLDHFVAKASGAGAQAEAWHEPAGGRCGSAESYA
jgi:NAD(P)-dependent dehydrogenase (short-subunit alcohol dehydrogenase family)